MSTVYGEREGGVNRNNLYIIRVTTWFLPKKPLFESFSEASNRNPSVILMARSAAGQS
jgi:hypothetical protein